MENVRIRGGDWRTRYGYSFFDPQGTGAPKDIGGTGGVFLLRAFYRANGDRYRIAARVNAGTLQVYDWQIGTDTSWQLVTGGGSLSVNYIQGVSYGNYFYFSDLSGALRRYHPSPSSGNQIVQVSPPAAPTAAPRAKPWIFGWLEDWSTLTGWIIDDSTNFNLSLSSKLQELPAPFDDNTAKFDISSSSDGKKIRENIVGEQISSDYIACYIRQTDDARKHVAFKIGANHAGQFSFALNVPKKNEWVPRFFPVGGLQSISYKRFEVVDQPSSAINLHVSALALPGRLNGRYRYRYTHYNSATGAESEPSNPNGYNASTSPAGQWVDLSHVPTNNKSNSDAFRKSVMLDFTSDSGIDPSTDKIRIYRNGGVPALTVDQNGIDVWKYVGEIKDYSTSLASSVSAGETSISIPTTSNISVGDYIVIDKETVRTVSSEDLLVEEYVKVTARTEGSPNDTLTIYPPLVNAHPSGAEVQVAFLDNVPDESLAFAMSLDVERDGPPSGVQWIDEIGDRLWLFGFSGNPCGVCVSNQPTALRPDDQEIFPDGVDPITRRHPTQGWRFQVAGEDPGEKIMWGGNFRGVPTVLTRKSLYQINAYSQEHWGPDAIIKRMSEGCIEGRTVAVVDDVLIWVDEGPRVLAWDGSGPPRDISYLRVSERLKAAPSSHWGKWHAVAHRKEDGAYYCLFYVPAGSTTPTACLQYSIAQDAWEPISWVDNTGASFSMDVSTVLDGPGDTGELYTASSVNGRVFYLDDSTKSKDSYASANDTSIRIRYKTPGLDMRNVSLVTEAYIRAAAVSDTLTLNVLTVDTEYGNQSNNYSMPLSGGGEKETRVFTHFSQKGRRVQFTISGEVNSRPSVRHIDYAYIPQQFSRIGS